MLVVVDHYRCDNFVMGDRSSLRLIGSLLFGFRSPHRPEVCSNLPTIGVGVESFHRLEQVVKLEVELGRNKTRCKVKDQGYRLRMIWGPSQIDAQPGPLLPFWDALACR